MTPRSVLVITCALLGVLMVAGAFGLLYKGIIKLDPPPPRPGEKDAQTELSVANVIKLKTNIAALVLFAFGFAFLFLGFHAPEVIPSFMIRGQIAGVSAEDVVRVFVCGGPWLVEVHSDHTFDYKIKPDLEQFEVNVGREGSASLETRGIATTKSAYVIPIQDGVADLGVIEIPPTSSAERFTGHAGPLPSPPKVDYGGDDGR